MTARKPTAVTADVHSSLVLIGHELDTVTAWLLENATESLETLADTIARAERIFVLGAGRSGLALQMTAMRLMHLGMTVHVVGEVTAPAIGPGDVLLTASGSGTTPAIVRGAEVAASEGAHVAVVTTAEASPLAQLATALVVVPAAGKLDRSATASGRHAAGRRSLPFPLATVREER
jgi:6-phospho-3-hexuloisomerase